MYDFILLCEYQLILNIKSNCNYLENKNLLDRKTYAYSTVQQGCPNYDTRAICDTLTI